MAVKGGRGPDSDFAAAEAERPPPGEDPVTAAEQEQIYRAGEEVLRDKLRQYGLESLEQWAFEQLRLDYDPQTIILRLRETPEFAERFPGIALRTANGYAAISPADYLRIESQMRQTMETAGLPRGFYDDVSDFAEFIGNDVSPDEVTERVAMAVTAVRSINPALRTQLQEMYGVGVDNDGELIAYYLDPDRAVNVIEQRLQLEAAGMSAAAQRTLGQGLNTGIAEQLVDVNVQQREIGDRLKNQAGLRSQLVGETGKVTSSELAAAEFGLDSEATAQVRSLRQRRQESARRASGSLAANTGISGLGSSGS
jgi:hypothetical protein